MIALPAIRWTLFDETDRSIQDDGMSALSDVYSPAADSLIRELLVRGHSNGIVVEDALGLAHRRHVPVPAEALAPYLRSYRLVTASWAREVNNDLGYAKPPPFNPEMALHASPIETLIPHLDSLFVPPLDPTARFVMVTRDFGRTASRDTIRGWVLSEDSTMINVLTLHGTVERIPHSQIFMGEGDSTVDVRPAVTTLGIEEEASRLLRLRAFADSNLVVGVDKNWLPRDQPLNKSIDYISLGYALHKAHRDSLAAQFLVPAFAPLHEEYELLDVVGTAMAQVHWDRMRVAFAGERDYTASLEEAHLILSRYLKWGFVAEAKELSRQLPLRTEDFKSFRLPTPKEWDEMKPAMTRQDQIKYLCERLRLLGQNPYIDQYAEAPGLNLDMLCPWWPAGGTAVLNPFLELRGPEKLELRKTADGKILGAKNRGRNWPGPSENNLRLSISDIPTLAPYLMGSWYMGDASLTDTRDLVAEIINSLVPHDLCRISEFKRLNKAGQEKEVARIVRWAKHNANRSPHEQVLAALEDSRSFSDVEPMFDYLVENRVQESLPKLLSFMRPGFGWVPRDFVLAGCRTIDAEESVPEARRYLNDPEPPVRFTAGLIVYESGDRRPGLTAMMGALGEKEYSSFFRIRQTLQDANAILLSTEGEDERELARLITDLMAQQPQ